MEPAAYGLVESNSGLHAETAGTNPLLVTRVRATTKLLVPTQGFQLIDDQIS